MTTEQEKQNFRLIMQENQHEVFILSLEEMDNFMKSAYAQGKIQAQKA